MKTAITILIIFVLGALLYGLTLRGDWGTGDITNGSLTAATKPFESSHERAPFVNMLSIFNSGSSELSLQYANFASPDVGIYEGKFYSYFPPGISYWILPFYEYGMRFNLAQLFAYGSISIFSILSSIMLFLVSKNIFKMRLSISLLVAIIFAFGSTAWGYSITIYQHAATVFLMLLGFYSVWKYKQGGNLSFFWGFIVWGSYGISIFVDYPNGVLLLPILIYFLFASLKPYSNKESFQLLFRFSSLFTSIVLALVVIGFIYFNIQTFGNWKILSNILPRYDTNQLKDTQNLDPTQLEQQNVKKSNFQLLKEERIINGLYELLIAPDKGLFIFSPIFIIGFLGVLYSLKKMSLEKSILLSIILLNILFYASFFDPYGGWAFGPRYIIPAMAALSVFVGIFLNESHKFNILNRILVFILFTISSAIALLGALTTNATPPKVEAVYLQMKYGFLYNLDFLNRGATGSFIYNNFFKNTTTLTDYYLYILVPLIIIAFILLFIIPIWERKAEI